MAGRIACCPFPLCRCPPREGGEAVGRSASVNQTETPGRYYPASHCRYAQRTGPRDTAWVPLASCQCSAGSAAGGIGVVPTELPIEQPFQLQFKKIPLCFIYQ